MGFGAEGAMQGSYVDSGSIYCVTKASREGDTARSVRIACVIPADAEVQGGKAVSQIESGMT